MEAIKRKQGLDRTPAPCEYFSFIGGTSTGGYVEIFVAPPWLTAQRIIAILLGPLRMTVGEALGAYNAVAKDAFTPKRHLRYSTKTGKYSATKLKTATQNILVASDHAHNDREAFYRNPECVKTIVLAVTKEDVSRGPTLFRTYADDAQYAETKIWEVIRATSAAVTFFKPIAVGRDQIEFMDAGFGCNNPCDVLIQECAKASQDQGISCVVSIGTGLGRAVGVTGRRSLLAALAKMATQSQQVHTRLRDQHAADVARIYWRFDEDVAISEIEMDDYKKMPKISSFTSNYLKDDTTKRLIENCADTIIDARNTKENIEPAGMP